MRKAVWPTTLGLAGMLIAAVALPALADVKAGVDAWSRGEYKKAVEEWRSGAVAGDPQAQFNLGQAYKLGRGVPADIALAESWYRKAAVQALPEAEDNYGLVLFQNGKRAEALPWLQKSVSRGEPRAQLVLGTMLYNGDGVPRDWPRAYALLVRSSGAGLPQAASVLSQMDQYIPADQRQQGMLLARQYEAEAQRPQLPPEIAGAGSAVAMQNTDLPGSSYDPNGGRNPQLDAPPPPPRQRPMVVAQPMPRQPMPRQPAPVRVATSGNWRVQLGAFGDPGNARKLWGQVGGRFPGRQAFYVKSGNLTRLLVGPFGSSSEAGAACGSVRPCVVVGS